MTQPENEVGKTAMSVAGSLAMAQPGDLAALRRMTPETGAPLFWRLAARHDEIARAPERWMQIVRMIAILTPTGAPSPARSVQDDKRPLGAVLCDGGEAGHIDQPVLSEQRLARLLAARGKTRRDALERAVRMLARRGVKLNVVDLAWAVLNPAGSARIAQSYYQRLDQAAATKTEDVTP